MSLKTEDMYFQCTPPQVQEIVSNEAEALLPSKSKHRYEHLYQKFCEWKLRNKAKVISEDLILTYISERSSQINSASLWAEFSMLKSMLKIKENIDISKWKKIVPFLKQNAKGYAPKKSKTLDNENCLNFLKEAPDETHLMIKVALILGIYGACRRCELTSFEIDQIEIYDDRLVITIPDTKKYSPRTFAITNEAVAGINMVDIFKKYYALRPSHTTHKRLFIYYRNGKCTTTPVGKNTFSNIPSKIAKYLNLKNPELYTGHCFRRSSAFLLASPDKRGGRNPSKVAEGDIDTSIENETKDSKPLLCPTIKKPVSMDDGQVPNYMQIANPSTSNGTTNVHLPSSCNITINNYGSGNIFINYLK